MYLLRNLCYKLPSIKYLGSHGHSPDLEDEDCSCSSVVFSDCETLGTETQFTNENLND